MRFGVNGMDTHDRIICQWNRASLPQGAYFLRGHYMDFKIWKVSRSAGDNPPWYSFSLQKGGEIPIILNQDKFNRLFPNLSDKVPEAPETGIIHIEAKIVGP